MGEDDKGFKVVQASGGGRLCHAYAALSVFRFALDMLRLAKEVGAVDGSVTVCCL